ncbi:MAG: tripartite tricarboxylate transporter TctB family protein [Spirochaetaceae bacterium]|jgi:hypothetical protein|nr:tripartite tricarboxylate transporter TctB family protein [Spirochaetaceae bacterium]
MDNGDNEVKAGDVPAGETGRKTAGREEQFNFFGALGLLIFTAFYIVQSFRIKDFSTAKWYESAALFPKIIGCLLFLLCLIYLIKNIRGAALTAEDGKRALSYIKSGPFLRLVMAAGFLAFYVFVLLRVRIGAFDLPYEAATFIYLFVNMLVFRTPKFAVWKILIISAVIAFAVGFCFTHGAKIPLP